MKIKINEDDLQLEYNSFNFENYNSYCEPYCEPNCNPTCNPVCSPSCLPCYPGNHCNPETFYCIPERED